MRIAVLTLSDLIGRGSKLWADGCRVLPPHRLESQCANPRALKDDPVLFLAEDPSGVVGFLSVIPDVARGNEGDERMGWVSGWWADPARRETGVGAMLLLRALSLWQGRLAVSGFTPEAGKVYTATRKFAPLAQFQNRDFRLTKSPEKGPELESADPLAPEIKNFLKRVTSTTLFHRAGPELAWMLTYPWINQQKDRTDGYPFAAFEPGSSMSLVAARNKAGTLASLALLVVRAKPEPTIKVKQLWAEDTGIDALALALPQLCVKLGAARLQVLNTDLATALSNPAWVQERCEEIVYLWGKPLATQCQGLVLPGDGDLAFT